jgi:hypothetical protein
MARMIARRAATLVPHGDPPTYFTFRGLGALGLPHVTTTRHFPGVTLPAERGGPFNEGAAAALRAAGLDAGRVAYARQVHGAEVLRPAPGGGWAGTGDVLATTERGTPLAIFTADCLALTLWDAIARVLVLAHVGWRGTVRGATRAAVQAAIDAGGRAARLHAAVGPSIGPCCYEVDDPVLRDFRQTFGDRARAWFRPAREGHAMLDLWSANETLLAEAGVDPSRIETPHLCTACHPDLLYSYRKRNSGRLVTVAALP